MPRPRFPVCLGALALSVLSLAQTAPPPTAFTIKGPLIGAPAGSTMQVSRSGDRVVFDRFHAAEPGGAAAHHSYSYYDLKANITYDWDSGATPLVCNAGRFSGDWGDPFAMSAEVTSGIAKGEVKPAGEENINGIAAKIYANVTPQGSVKVWFDEKDGLVLREIFTMGTAPAQRMIDIRQVYLKPPPEAAMALPAECASVHPPPTPDEVIAAETGDSASNYVSAINGPGSKNSCSVLLRVVHAQTLAPISSKIQVAIDTTYDVDHPPSYVYGLGTDGTQTFSGGGIHEITNQVRNGIVHIGSPPAAFHLEVNLMKPNYGAASALIYRQCFAPTTVLLYVVKNPDKPTDGGDWLWAKGGKLAAPAPH